MPSLATPFISSALSRLRAGVCACCWLVALSLIAQLLVWGVVSFMDVRHKVLEDQQTPATVVSAADAAKRPLGSLDAHPLESPSEAKASGESAPPNPNHVVTKYEPILSRTSTLAMSAGTIGMLMMIPMLMVGVMLAAGSATPGVEKVVSAFMWSLLMTMLVLPVGQYVGLPWTDGGLVHYDQVTHEAEVQMAGGKWGGAMFYARFALLPLACLFGVGMIGFRFSLGVTSGIIAKEDTRLDPLLEREAANMKATSLIGGRTAAALRNVAPSPAAPVVAPLNAPPLPAPSATVVTAAGTGEIKPGMLQAVAGEAPKRLI